MRSDRPRQNHVTRMLLDFESRLLQVGVSNDKKYRRILRDILNQIQSTSHIYSSMEAHRFLQLSMLYIAARLHISLRSSEAARFKVSTSVYNAKHDLLVVKPCYFFPGRCSIRHPTILLHPDDREAPPSNHQIGLSGLALISGQVLHCTNLQGPNACAFYVPLNSESASALSVPLSAGLESAVNKFNQLTARSLCPTSHCCSGKPSLHRPPDPGSSARLVNASDVAPIYGVLNIDCSTAELDVKQAQRILKDKEIREVLRVMVERLAGHQKNRDSYRVLRTCSALFQLSQHTLGPRQAYVSLLREIAEVCDGADVTLHLKDMFDDKDQDRSVRLVAGVGDRFRGFLIGERYGDGLVGEAMRKGQFVDLDAEEINGALTGERPCGYRRLMPRTALNAVVPLHFHRRVIGAINIEWEKPLRDKLLRTQSEEHYLSSKRSVLNRLASYMSLIVDYFDDAETPNLAPSLEIARESHYTRSVTSRRRVLAYYVGSALKWLDADLQNEQQRDSVEKHLYLHDIINAIGYFLTFESKHRILSSVRRTVGDKLELVHDHGLDQSRDPKKEGLGGPIPIILGQSVLGSCAELGIPIFGTIENASFLNPDPLCVECAPVEDREFLRRYIRYKPAGHCPVYEVSVPLVLGREVTGTFDFELFSVGNATAHKRRGAVALDQPLALAGHELAPFLEWARAITFCMACAEDALNPDRALAGLTDKHRAAYRRFQRLCAQIIANVAIPEDLLTPIAGEYLRALIPVRELKLDRPAEGMSEESPENWTTPDRVIEKTQDLWWRGQHLGKLSLALDRETWPPRSVFTDTSLSTGTGRLTQSFIAAFYTAALSANPEGDFNSKEFKVLLGTVQAAFEEKIAVLKKNGDLDEIDPYGIIENYFILLDQCLRDRLLPAGTNDSAARPPSRHGWFLYMAQCTEDPEHNERAVLRCGVPFARWAAMSTQEMRSHVSTALDSQDSEDVLLEILGPELGEEVLAAWRANPRSATDQGAAAMENLFLEALARKVRDYPDPSRLQKPSLTTATARLQQVLTFIDLNRSPIRSARQREWFFGDKAYSVVSVPIIFCGTSIGVLQIFRRRDAIDDVLFFKNDEIQSVRDLGEALQKQIAEEVEWLRIPALRDAAVEKNFSLTAQDLGANLRERIAAKQSPLIVACDFLADSIYCQNFIREYIGDACEIFTTGELARLEKPEMRNKPLVCILFPEGNVESNVKEKLRALTGQVSTCTTVILVSRSTEIKSLVTTMLQSPPYVVSQRVGEPHEILQVAFGRAEGKEGGSCEEIVLLFRRRRSGPWTLSQLMEDCGVAAGEARQLAPVLLNRFKEPNMIGRRLLPSWYQHEKGLA